MRNIFSSYQNSIFFKFTACNCSETGMVACTRRPGFVECTCQPGYAGVWCEECAPGNFRAGKECIVCPCSNLTSTAECKMGTTKILVLFKKSWYGVLKYYVYNYKLLS